ncbi:MAG: hypothetical protein PWQ88_779 [Candidatus Methanomethylophilaceae archaeon]|nr:hypothetical protein [Candidatus Methanomethylophilaceae archaeon]MDI3541923.1 hypothetical protein [Candidatus Methanomethylophilaceae archaeon]HIJ00302.1 Holliday junction resolvase [Candidatus Methanomethylophilaceae archaeon]
MGDIYERELKNLLSADEKTLDKMLRTCDEEERLGYRTISCNPFMMVRAAGSFGSDLVAMRWDIAFPIEVKSSIHDVLHFSSSPQLMEQADRMSEACAKAGLIPVYAYRLKKIHGDPWRLFSLPMDTQFKGRHALLQRYLPPIEKNNNGNLIMRWKDGVKLSSLLAYLEFLRAGE